jgi:hypothetical protein
MQNEFHPFSIFHFPFALILLPFAFCLCPFAARASAPTPPTTAAHRVRDWLDALLSRCLINLGGGVRGDRGESAIAGLAIGETPLGGPSRRRNSGEKAFLLQSYFLCCSAATGALRVPAPRAGNLACALVNGGAA